MKGLDKKSYLQFKSLQAAWNTSFVQWSFFGIPLRSDVSCAATDLHAKEPTVKLIVGPSISIPCLSKIYFTIFFFLTHVTPTSHTNKSPRAFETIISIRLCTKLLLGLCCIASYSHKHYVFDGQLAFLHSAPWHFLLRKWVVMPQCVVSIHNHSYIIIWVVGGE